MSRIPYTCAIVAVILAIGGCITNSSTATSVMPDGTEKTLRQRTIVTLGAKLTDGQLAFGAESVGADGSNWTVTSGTDTNGAQTPEISTVLLQALLDAQVQRAQIEAAKPQGPSVIEELSEAVQALRASERAARNRLPSDY